MAQKILAYGSSQAFASVFPAPRIANGAPASTDVRYPLGQIWVDKSAGGGAYVLQRLVTTGGVLTASWVNTGGAGGAFDSLIVTPGPTSLTGVFGTSGGIASINESSNFATNINTGTSTGAVSIGNASAGAITVDTAAGISLDAATASNFTVTGASADATISSVGGSVNITASESAADAIVINASGAAGGVEVQAGTGGVLVGNQADCTTIDIGDIAPTASRLITIGGGTIVTAAVTDTIDIAPDGATTNANSIKTVNINTGTVVVGELHTNIASGVVTSGTHATEIASGNVAAGTVTLNIMTGTGTKTASIGNADANTTVNVLGVLNINTSVNAAVAINTGTSTGTVTIGNALSGAITADTASGISLDGATASNFTVTGAGIDLTLSSSGGSVVIAGSEAIASAINLTASDLAGGVTVDAGTGGISLDATGTSNFTITGALDLTLSSSAGSTIVSGGEAVIDAVQLTAGNAAGGVRVTSGTLAATTGLNLVQGAANASIQVGSGDPTHNAPKGSLYIKVDATTTTTRLWINTDGTNGWTFFTSNA